MKIGLGAPVSGAWATPETLTRVAVRAEELGYDSLWTFQRLLVGVDDRLDAVYQSVLHPPAAVELYYDLNWHDRIGNPDIETETATKLAMEIIEALAPR